MLKRYAPRYGDRVRQYYIHSDHGTNFVRLEGTVVTQDGDIVVTSTGQFLPNHMKGKVIPGNFDNSSIHTVRLKPKTKE